MRWTVPLLLVAALLSAACDDGDDHPDAPRTIARYVAMGDSYTAGSGIGTPVGDAGAGCGQTTKSYPRLVAAELGAELTDASCAGAATASAFISQTKDGTQVWPAQLSRLSTDIDLVTVSFGYNELDFFVRALVACVAPIGGSTVSPACASGGQGTTTDASLLAEEIGDRLQRVVEQAQKRAPHALVLVVGYPQPVPAEGTCADLPLIEGGYAESRANLGLLDDAMREAAERTGATFVDVFGASDGHDICAGDQAWVNGQGQTEGVAVAFHPYQREQDAVARLIEDAVAGF